MAVGADGAGSGQVGRFSATEGYWVQGLSGAGSCWVRRLSGTGGWLSGTGRLLAKRVAEPGRLSDTGAGEF